MPSFLCKLGILLVLQATPATSQNELPVVSVADWPYLQKHISSLLDAMAKQGVKFSDEDGMRLKTILGGSGGPDQVRELQQLLDARVLIGVNVNPESRVKAQRGSAMARLQQNNTGVFLIKVHNEAGVTQPLKITGPNVATNKAEQQQERWLLIQAQSAKLSGRPLEYVVVAFMACEAGKREAKLVFDVGQGTQDLGFRAEVPVLFNVAPKQN